MNSFWGFNECGIKKFIVFIDVTYVILIALNYDDYSSHDTYTSLPWYDYDSLYISLHGTQYALLVHYDLDIALHWKLRETVLYKP